MTDENAVTLVRQMIPDYLDRQGNYPDPSGKYNCPDPDHPDEHPSASIEPGGKFLKCWSHPGGDSNFSIFDLIGLYEKMPRFADQKKRAFELYHLVPDGVEASEEELDRIANEVLDVDRHKRKATPAKRSFFGSVADYTDYFEECQARAEPAIKSWTDRGISREVCVKHGVGYDPHLFCPALSNYDRTRCGYIRASIIPVSKSFYFARNLDPDAPKGTRHLKPSIENGAISAPMGVENLDQVEEPVFIVEGPGDAMSLETAGGRAIATGGANVLGQLVSEVQSRPNRPVLFLAFDNDDAGREGAENLAKELKEIGAQYINSNIIGTHHDVNDRLQADPEGLRRAIQEAIAKAAPGAIEETQKDEALVEYNRESAKHFLGDLMRDIKDSANRPPAATGFTVLDGVLDGGMYPGVYTLMAATSLGKSSWAMQAVDHFAQHGRDVLYFSYEMSRFELATRSISRLTYLTAPDDRKYLAKSMRDVTKGASYPKFSREEKGIILNAFKTYSDFAGRIYFLEERYSAQGGTGPDEMLKAIQKHIEVTGNVPICVIDYIQLCKPYDPRLSEKSNLDHAMKSIKQVSRDLKVPVLIISSVNRESYSARISLSAAKESGICEYTSDVVLGMQAEGAGDKGFDIDFQKRRNPRKIEILCLKNRSGKSGATIGFDYFPQFNLFFETGIKGAAAATTAANAVPPPYKSTAGRTLKPKSSGNRRA